MLKLLCTASIVVDFAGFQSLTALGAPRIHRVLSMLNLLSNNFVVVQSLICVQLFAIPWTAAHEASLSFTSSQNLLKLMSTELVIPSNHLILCHPFSCHQSFPSSGSFPVSWLFVSGGQNIGVSASSSVLPMNIQGWFLLGLTVLISLQSKNSQESSPVPQFKGISSLVLSLLYCPALISTHDYWKTKALNIQTFPGNEMFLLFNTG